jgi:PPP family 3-phenylpropionic acid transporter
MAHLVSQGGAFRRPKRYGRVRLWGSLGFLITVMVAGAGGSRRFGLGQFPRLDHW